MTSFWKCVFGVLIMCFEDIKSLKDVTLSIQPQVVERGELAVLTCNYDLEGAVLYKVAWYYRNNEFYRYIPDSITNTNRVFDVPGMNVDLANSNDRQVTVTDVDFKLSGTFLCEVSIDGPPFSTAHDSKEMKVVVLPKEPPSLVSDKSDYVTDDVLRAICTSTPSYPAVRLSFTVNNIVVCPNCEVTVPVANGLFGSSASLELHLYHSHFNGGRLLLRCLAQIQEIYEESTELLVGNLGSPTYEKVTSGDRRVIPYYYNVLFYCAIIVWLTPLHY